MEYLHKLFGISEQLMEPLVNFDVKWQVHSGHFECCAESCMFTYSAVLDNRKLIFRFLSKENNQTNTYYYVCKLFQLSYILNSN